MTDHEIHELTDKKCQGVYKDMTDLVDRYTVAMTTVFTERTQGIKDSIDELTKRVDIQNGSVRSLKEWRAGIEGQDIAIKNVENKRHLIWNKVWQALGVIVAIGSLLIVLNSKRATRETELKEDILKEIRTTTQPTMISRGGMVYDPIDGRVYIVDSIKTVRIDSVLRDL